MSCTVEMSEMLCFFKEYYVLIGFFTYILSSVLIGVITLIEDRIYGEELILLLCAAGLFSVIWPVFLPLLLGFFCVMLVIGIAYINSIIFTK